MTDQYLDSEMNAYGIPDGGNTTRAYKMSNILEAQEMMGDFIDTSHRSLQPQPKVFPMTPPRAKRE